MVVTTAQESPTPFLHVLHVKTEQDFNSCSWPLFVYLTPAGYLESGAIGKKLFGKIGANSKYSHKLTRMINRSGYEDISQCVR